MSKQAVVSVREDHQAHKDAESARVAKLAKQAHTALITADRNADRSLLGMAKQYGIAGQAVLASKLSVRGFAIVAEYGERETFDALGLTQPRKLTSYVRAHDIAKACDAVGVDVTEAVTTYVLDAREAQASGVKVEPTLSGFATYCAAGFAFPAVKPASVKRETSDAFAKVVKLAESLSADELAELATMFAKLAKKARKVATTVQVAA